MNLTYTRPGELRKPDVEVLPDGRIRITRYIAAGHGDRDLTEVTESVGTADKGVATALLVKRGMAQVAGKDAIVKTYEVMNASSETQVGLPDVQYTESGQKTMVYDFIQMSSGTYTPGTIGTTTAPGDGTCVLRTEQVEDDGTTRQIRRTFINKGLLQQTDETKNNGALLLKTFVYLNDAPVPNPPTGYTLVSQQTQNPNGLETTTYVYARGNGEVSRDIDYNNSGDQGATGITRTTIRHLVVPGASVQPVSLAGSVEVGRSFQDLDGHRIWTTTWAKGTGQISYEVRYVQSLNQGTSGATVITIRHLTDISVNTNPISTPAGTVLISEDKSNQDGYRIWTAVYAKGGSGIVSSTTDTQNGGKLILYRRTAIGAAPTTPSATIGTVVSTSQTSRNDNGYVIYDYSWAEGVGVVGERIQYRDGGLRLINREILLAQGASDYSAYTPAGIEVDRGYTEADGVRRYSVTWMQSNGGGDPTSSSLAFGTKVAFTYPGRAKAYYATFSTGAYTSHKAYDVFMSPPVQCLIDATTNITYTTANGAPSPSYTLWNPTDWAVMRAKWIGWSNSPRSKVDGLRGYIAVNGGEFGTSITGYDVSVLGDRVYASTDFSIILSGGPSDPAGNMLTLSIEKVPAFTSPAGVQYYRVTEVFAYIPTQPGLPV